MAELRIQGETAVFTRSDAQVALRELKNLHVALEDGTEIVKGVDLAVNTDEIHAIMGPNGSGKSTLGTRRWAIPPTRSPKATSSSTASRSRSSAPTSARSAVSFLAFQYRTRSPA